MVHTAALVLGGGFFSLSAFLAARAMGDGLRARLLRTTPRVRLSELRPGLVKVGGRVRLGRDVLTAPLTRRRCAYYRVEVFQRLGGRSKRWVRVFRGAETALFHLEDDTGVARIHLANAEVELATEAGFGEDRPLPPEVEARFRERFGRAFPVDLVGRPTRYAEAALEEGEPLFVLGTAEPAPEGGFVVRKAESLCVASGADGAEGQLAVRADHHQRVALFQAVAAALVAVFILYAGWR